MNEPRFFFSNTKFLTCSTKFDQTSYIMRKLRLLSLCRKRLLSPFTAGEAPADHARLFAARLALCRTQGLSSSGSAASFGSRYIHASGFCLAPQRDYYETLGVSKSASKDDIKKAFRMMAKKYHPDANRDNPSYKRKFQEIREAYETLQNPEKRAEYDMKQSSGYAAGDTEGFRYNYHTQGSTADTEGFGHGFKPHFTSSFHKIFSEIFEHDFDRVATDIQVELSLSFSEAARGCTKNLSVASYVPCDSCDGCGYPLKAKTKTCPICRGIGRVTIPPFTSTCSTCKGSGQLIKEHCVPCGGLVIIEGTREVDVSIPAGVDSGDTIRVPGAGNSGPRQSQPGSLYIKLKVAKDPTFARDGADVYVDYNISFTQAILGGKIEVPTLTGKTEIKISKGVQPGEQIVLRGKGLPRHGFLVHHGDQYVRFRVQFPTKINERQHAILEEFAMEEIIHGNNNSNDKDWFQQMTERVMGPKFVLELSIFLLIFLLLSKITS